VALQVQRAEVEPGFGEIGAVCERERVAVGGVFAPPEPVARDPQVQMRIGVVAAHLDAALETLHGFLVAAGAERCDTCLENRTVL
jgi:hypothetical protein